MRVVGPWDQGTGGRHGTPSDFGRYYTDQGREIRATGPKWARRLYGGGVNRPGDRGPAPTWAGDLGCMVVALFIGGLATDATNVASGSYAHVNDLVGVASVVALWWRRRAPLVVAALTFVAATIAPMAGGAAIVSVYTVAAHHRGRWISLGMTALYVTYLVSAAVSLALFRDEDLGTVGGVLAATAMTIAAYGWGLAVRSRHELLIAQAERAERAEADQQARAAETRRAERARIAAEMHDALAHRLSLLSLHAGAIELRPDAPPDERAEAARVVRSNAHLALDDLRRVIGVLPRRHRRRPGSPAGRRRPRRADRRVPSCRHVA